MPRNKQILKRIAAALERLAPGEAGGDPLASPAMVWQGRGEGLAAVDRVNRVGIDLLKGIDDQKRTLLANTRRFARGLPANNALLWGARGSGKSSLVKAVHGSLIGEFPDLRLVEIHREDLSDLPRLLSLLAPAPARFILFCDDLSFDAGDLSYKSLKAALEGGIEGRPDNVLFYATSNRRHLMPREMIENERASGINPGEAVDEKVSLSDRFGLWLGFHAVDQDDYLAMVEGYAGHFGLKVAKAELHARAIEWSMGRGARSGRVAWQFIQDLAGRLAEDSL